MAVEMTYEYPNAERLLSRIIENDARPIIILNGEKTSRVCLYENLFSDLGQVLKMSFYDFMSEYVYSIKKQQELLDCSYILIDDVENLRGLSATLKILSNFIDNMVLNNVSVIFMGENTTYDMREVLHIIGSKIHYIIKIESERTNNQ